MDWMTRNGRTVAGAAFYDYAEAPDRSAGVSRAVLADTLDTLGFGVAVVSFSGAMLHANRVAAARLAELGPVRPDALPTRADLGPSLRAGLEQAAMGRRSAVLIVTPVRVLRAVLVPLAADDQAAALIFERGANCEPLALGLFSREHRLTPTEQIVLSGLGEGLRVAEIARQLGAAISTVRTHVRRLLEKTSARRQADLMGMLAAMPALAPANVGGG